jgi:hypothetical protein
MTPNFGSHPENNSKRMFLGYFEDLEDAALARRKAEKLYQKEFAWQGTSTP